MSTPTNGSPHDPHHGGDSASGSQHSAPSFGGGWQQNQHGDQSANGGSGSTPAPSYGAPSYGSPSPPGQPDQNGTPQYRPAGGQYGGGHQQGGTGRKGKGRPPLWVGLVSLGLGLLLGVIAIIVFITSIVGAVGDVADTPSGAEQALEEDTEYFVFSTGTDSVDECTVYTPQYDSIDLEMSGNMDQTVTDNDQTFRLVGTFTTQEEGDYSVSCSPYVADDEMHISDAGIGGAVGGTLASVGLGLLGGLLFILGIILIIVNRVSASKNRG